jgi:predicted GTPase
MLYHPGETNYRRADVVVINKMDTASPEKIQIVLDNIRRVNPKATIIRANSPIIAPEGGEIAGKRVLVIEDGPTVTHGEMSFGAGVVAAQKYGAAKIVDPRPAAVGSIKATFAKYRHLVNVLPAMGYGEKQVEELGETINAVDCDLVVSATPIDIRRLIKTNKKIIHIGYELEEQGSPNLKDVLARF